MAQKKADSPMADTILIVNDIAKNILVPETYWRKPKRTFVEPDKNVP